MSAAGRRTAPAIAAALALALACPIAGAQCGKDADCAADRICADGACAEPPPPDPDAALGGRIRLDLDLGVAGGAFAMGAREADYEIGYAYNFGPVPNIRFGLGIGYDLDGRLSLGARLDLGFATARHTDFFHPTDDAGEELTRTVVEVAALPYLERAFGAGRVRPVLTLVAGFAYALWDWKTVYNDADDDVKERKEVLLLGVVGLGVGLRAALTERVDLDFGLLWTIGVGELTAEDIEDGPQHEEWGAEGFAWCVRADILVGLTGWI